MTSKTVYLITLTLSISWAYNEINIGNYLILFVLFIPITVFFISVLILPHKLKKILILSFTLKSFLAIINEYFPSVFSPPGKLTNAKAFIAKGHDLSLHNVFEIFSHNQNNGEYFVSLIGLLFKLVGPNNFYVIYINILLSLMTIILVYKIVTIISNNKVAVESIWFAAFFPGFIILSTVELREAIIVYFFILSIYHGILYTDSKSLKTALFSFFYGILSGLFHISGVISVSYILFQNIRYIISIKSIIIVATIIAASLTLVNYNFGYNKIHFLYKYMSNQDYSSSDNFFIMYQEGGIDKKSYYYTQSTTFGRLFEGIIKFSFYPYLPNPGFKLNAISGILFWFLTYWFFKYKPQRISKEFFLIAIVMGLFLITLSLGTSGYVQALRHKMKLIPLINILFCFQLRYTNVFRFGKK